MAPFRICEAYYLPAWCSIADYEWLMREQGMQARRPPPRRPPPVPHPALLPQRTLCRVQGRTLLTGQSGSRTLPHCAAGVF